ncbi:MAG TPA: MlaD family protein [Longimicrobiales bacterium]|nr:MlaD family protein [Longimicrobiales bacterium]
MTARRDELLAAMPRLAGGRDVKIGIFAIVGVVATVVTLLLLTDPGMFRGRMTVLTAVSDAGGLRRGDPVQMRGVNIGRVQTFAIGQDSVQIRMELEREYPVPADSYVLLRSSGLLGGMVAEVVPGASQQDLKGGERIPGRTERGILDPGAGIGSRADTVLSRVQELLNRQTITDVGAGAGELRLALAELSALVAEQRRELGGLSTSLRASASSVERATAGPELERAIARADSVAAALNVTAARLDAASGTLGEILARMERGEGTLGRLSADPELYDNLNQAAAEWRLAADNLSALVIDIRENPRKYFNLQVF